MAENKEQTAEKAYRMHVLWLLQVISACCQRTEYYII